MDSRYPREGNTRKRTRLRQMCSLCNEPSLPAKEQLKHFTSAVHRHMKQIKQKQFSYTKELRTLEEKIKASEEHNEPVIGLEYIYQYAADKRGVVPYVCMLCECVYKIDTIFFHIVGAKHRSLYLSKNFPAMGIDRNFIVKTSSEYRKLLNAAEIVENSHGRKKINVFNTLFNPKKNGGMKYDLESAGEGLSSSEDEQDNPDSAKPFHTDERKTLRSGVGDNNDRSVNRRGNPQFQGDRKGGPPLLDDGSVGPPFQYDGRRGPEVQDGHSIMNRSLRDHDNSGFPHDDHRGHYNHEDLELSYQQRGPDGRKAPGRRDFPDDRSPNSQMHRGGEAFQYSDRQGPPLQGDPRHDNNQVRNNDVDVAFQHGLSTRSRGNPHGDFDLPPMGLLPQQVDCDDIKGQNRTKNLPPGFPGDRDLQSQMHRGGTAFQYDRQDPILQGGPRHSDNGFDFRHNESTLGKPRDDYDMPSLGPLCKPVNPKDVSYPPEFPGDRNLGSRIHRDGKAFQYNDRQGPELQGGPRLTDNKVRANNREFAFQHESIQSPGASRGDLDMPSMGQVHQGSIKGQSMTPSYAPDFPGDHNLRSQMHRDGMAFQYNDRRGPTLQGGPRDIGNQLRNDDRDFAFQRDQSTQLLGSAHGDLNMPSMGPLHQQVDHDDIKSHNRTQNRPPGVFGDHDLQSQMHRDGMGFQCDDRQRPLLRDDPRQTGNQVRENNNDFALKHDRRTRWDDPHGDPNMPSLGPLRKPVESDDLRSLSRTQSHPPDFPGDHKLSTPMHRDEFQYGDRQGPMIHGDPRHTDNQLKNNDRAFAFQHDQSARLLDDAHGDPKMPSMGLLHQQEDRSDIMGRNRTQNHPPDFSGVRNLGSRMHRNGMEFQCDDRDLQSQMDRGGMAFPYDNIQGEIPQGDLSRSNNLMDKTNRGSTFQPDHQRPQLLPNVHGAINAPTMNSSFYQQGDRRVFEERSGAEDRRQGFSADRSLHSQNPQGGMVRDNRGGVDNRFLMRGDFITYQELKTAHQSGLGQGHGGLDEQDVTYNSDMEVCSMELSDSDPDAFLCNAELFEFLKTFHILSYEDEQFALKVRDMFTNSTIRYKNLKEELLKRRIAEEKERLEEEKKAFLEVRRAKERPKKERQKPSATAPNKKYAPGPNSSSKPPFPIAASSNAGLANKPTPLMSILVDPIHPPGAANPLQHSPIKSRPKGSMTEQRPPTMPAMNIHPERQSRWDQESLQTSSEMHLEERFNVPSQREDLFHSRGRVDATRNFPPRFPPHTGSAKY